MDVDRRGGGLDGGEAVVVAQGVEQLDVQHAAHAGHRLAGDADGAAGGGVVEGLGPAVGARHHLDAVGAKRVELADGAADGDGFEPGVAGDQEEAVAGLEQVRRAGGGVGAGEEIEEGMLGEFLGALIEQQGHAGGGLGDHAHRAVEDGVLHEAFAGEGGVVARRPGRASRDGRRRSTGRRGWIWWRGRKATSPALPRGVG